MDCAPGAMGGKTAKLFCPSMFQATPRHPLKYARWTWCRVKELEIHVEPGDVGATPPVALLHSTGPRAAGE